ncbi:MAG: hypothetical protein F6K17_25565, partial [Okeania sp. SIO3C4]|nr:hypothetical protein [Okeania sp. SIO3C4]
MLEAGGRRFSPIVTLILYTNDATGHDISPEFIAFNVFLSLRPIGKQSHILVFRTSCISPNTANSTLVKYTHRGEDAIASGQDAIASGQDAIASGQDAIASGQDARTTN